MRRPPRDPRAPLFTREMVARGVLLGLTTFVAVAVVFGAGLELAGENQARAMGFITLVVANLLLIAATRSRREGLIAILARPNRVFWMIAVLALGGLAAAAYLPGAAGLFRFEAPSPLGTGASILAAILAVVWIEALKRSRRREPAF